MSNTDSFIEEVTEEVRKDRLNALVRRYGWIAVLVVVAIVAASATWEWRKAQTRGAAEAFGDGILEALQPEDAGARLVALESVRATGDAFALRQLIAASEIAMSDASEADRLLRSVMTASDVSPRYRDLATLRLVMVPDVPVLSTDRIALLEPLTVPGAPFRLTALEQKALVHVERRETDQALKDLVILRDDVETSAAMRERATQLIVALGGLMDEE